MPASIRVLLAEPDASDRASIRRALRGREPRCRVTDAPSLERLRARLDNGGYDVALVSLDGWPRPAAGLESLHQLAPDLPIVALSHTEAPGDAAGRPVDGLVMKTEQSLNLLHETIATVVQRAQERRQRDDLIRRLQSAEHRHRAVFDSVLDAIVLCDAQGRVLDANPAAERLVQRPASELRGTPIHRWLKAEALHRPADWAGIGPLRATLPGSRPVEVRLVAIDAEEAAYVVVMRDMPPDERQQRTDEIVALTALSAIIDQSDLRLSLEAALAQVLQVAGMDAAGIALLDPTTGELRPFARQGVPDEVWQAEHAAPTHIGEGVAGRALASGGIVVISEVETDVRVAHREALLRTGLRTIVGVGLTGRNPVGALTLYSRAALLPATATLDWLSVAGHQTALSIENARLVDSTRRRQQMAEAIREVNAAVASTLDLDAVLETIFTQVRRVIPYQTSTILLVDGTALSVAAARGLADPSPLVGRILSRRDGGLAWQVIDDRQVLVCDDVQDSARPLEAPTSGAHSWIGAPLIAHNEVIGVLTLDHDQAGFYSPDDGRNVALIAQQAAVAIDNARRFAAEKERSNRLRALTDVGRQLIVVLDRDAILKLVAGHLTRDVGFTYADIFLVEDRSGQLIWHIRHDAAAPLDSGAQVRLPMGTGIVGHVAATRRTYFTGNVADDPHYVPAVGPRRTRSAMAVPLLVEDRLVGVLNIESDRRNAFSLDDVAMLETLAGQVDAALSLAELYAEAQQRAGNLATLFSAGQELSSSLDSDQVFGRLAQWIVSAADATSARVYVWDLPAGSGRLLAQYVGARAGMRERQSMIGVVQNLKELPQLVSAMAARQPILFTADAAQIDPSLVASLSQRGVAEALYLPLIVRERLIGCVEVWETGSSHGWSPDVLRICQTMATVAASAIDNARLFEAERQRRAVAETVRDLAAVVSSSLDLHLILDALLERAAELVPYDAAIVYIGASSPVAGEPPSHLRIAASRGLPREVPADDRPFLADGLVGLLLRSRGALIRTGVRDWLGAPLVVKGSVIGGLTFDSGTPGRYRREHAEIAETIANHAAVAIENARLYQETRQRLAELETLQVVSLELSQSLDVQRVSQAIATGALRLLDATAVHLFSFDQEADQLHMLAVTAAPGYEVVGQPTPRREGMTMRVAHTGRVVVVNDLENDPAFAPITRATALLGAKAMVGLPLRVRERVLGVMNVLFHRPHTIDDNDVRILSLLADRASTALENARLFEDEQRRRAAADVVREISAVLTSTLDLTELYETLFDQIARVIPYSSTSALLLTETHQLRVVAGRGFDRPERIVGQHFVTQPPVLFGAVIETRRPLIIEDVQRLSDWQAPPGLENIHGWMAVPLVTRDEIIGVLAVHHAQPGVYRRDQADLLAVIANQAAAAIANARLYQAEQRRARQLALVNRAGRDVSSILDVDQLAQVVTEEIRSVFGYYFVGVAMADGDEIVWRARAGGDMPDWSGLSLGRQPIGAGIVGAAAASGEVTLVRDVASDSRFIIVPEIARTRSEVALPLRAKGAVLGVLDVQSDRLDAFDEEDVSVLNALAGQLGVALENARLYQELADYAASLEERVAERTAEIRREQERTITILDSVADAVLVTDLTGAIVLTNPAAEALLTEDARADRPGVLQAWLRGLSPASMAPKITVNNRTFQAAVAYVGEDERTVGHVLVLRDITRMEEVDRMKTLFVTNVSHELRTPLTNIKLYLGLFQKGKPEKREQYLHTLHNEVNRLERLITDLLDLSRLERDRQTTTYAPIDIREVVQHVTATLEPQAEAKRQTLRLVAGTGQLPVLADRNQMIQVFVNLTANAINYTPAGGHIEIDATAVERDGGLWVKVAVQDDGIGIAPADQDRVFDRFFRGQDDQLGVRGTGLGLAIVKEIVDQHAGWIELQSQVGVGSVFTVWLPAGRSRPDEPTEGRGHS